MTQVTTLDNLKTGAEFYFVNKSGLPANGGKTCTLVSSNGSVFEYTKEGEPNKTYVALSAQNKRIVALYEWEMLGASANDYM